MKQLIEAFLKAQKEMGNAVKGSNNPYFKSKYADLNSVREACTSILNNHGIVIMQPMVRIDGDDYVQTILLHESGEKIESFTKILCKSSNDPQAYGSGVTYARRYGLQSLVSLGAEDDDGNLATKIDKDKILKELGKYKTVEELGKAYKNLTIEEQKSISNEVTELKNKLLIIQKTNNNEK